MSELASYSFLPWMRQGLAGQVTAADGDSSVLTRATVAVDLSITGQSPSGAPLPSAPVHRDVQLYGPGDIVGIDPRAIVRTDPRDWVTNAEPNYLAHIDFYDEDLPWRYTPAAPSGDGLRLRPWIALVVLEEEQEFTEVRAHGERPLPSIEVTNPAALPPAAELWAWAHVHVNASLSPSGGALVDADTSGVASRLAAAIASNRDVAYSRLVCPRRLKPNVRYHAFVVPTFESGRLAGLGVDPAGAPHATFSAWADYAGKAAAGTLPYYHRWYFRTGDQGDFEYLVRILVPRALDASVGVRDVDVRHPGPSLRGVTDPAVGGLLKLGGALRVPDAALSAEEIATRNRFEEWDQSPPAAVAYPQPFQQDMAAFVNLPDDYAVKIAQQANADSGLTLELSGDPDPLITSPLYGRWHALTRRLLQDRDGNPVNPSSNWIHELNLDPRHRLTAGFGTRVVQSNQERYMDAAWGQIGDVLEANRRIRLAQFAVLVSQQWWTTQLAAHVSTRPERVLRLTAPAHRHALLTDGQVRADMPFQPVPGTAASTSGASTLRHRLETSLVGATLTSAPMRRVTRPRARLARRLSFTEAVSMKTLLERVDAGEVAAAPPKTTPKGVVTTEKIADLASDPQLPSWFPGWLIKWLSKLARIRWMATLAFALAAVFAIVGVLLVTLGSVITVVIAVLVLVAALIAFVAGWAMRRIARARDQADALRPGALTPAAVDRLPAAPGFELTTPGIPTPSTPPGSSGGGGDSPTAKRFKTALRDWGSLAQSSDLVGVEPVLTRFGRIGLESLASGAVAAVEPAVTVPRRVLAGVAIPSHIADNLIEVFGEVMAYPRIDTPMYEPLRDLSDEYLLPNLNLIPPNSIALLETNQPFIEAYMVGLNHEMARELLWREYPTDQRGTPFRQFWDVSGARPAQGLSGEQAREALLDIPELHRWPRSSKLGDHDHREKPGDNEAEVVLVIRGELLKKYPTAIIYAHKARWDPDDGVAHPTNERQLVTLNSVQENDPPEDIVKTPLYEARVSPDITFFGFDLTVPVAKGGDGSNPNDDAGWFFCIKERPGEPRFGFDIEAESADPPETVNDVAWPTIGTAEGAFLAATALSPFILDPTLEPDDAEKVDQRADDLAVLAAAPPSAARWAYIAYQAPVLVAVHAAEMLRRGNP